MRYIVSSFLVCALASCSDGAGAPQQDASAGDAASGSDACVTGCGSKDAGAAGDAVPDAAVATRDKLKQPFASTSIWNMPIGSAAVYVDAKLRAVPDGSGYAWSLPFAEMEQIVLVPTAPLTDIRYSSVGWGSGDRCAPTSNQVFATVPIPSDFLVPSNAYNMASAILGADGRSIYQFEPFAHCTNGSPATALVMDPSGTVDLYGDGILGAHGGSGMSALGGTLRLDELRPGDQGPRHALKFTFDMKDAYKCTTASACFRWPAQWADSYAVGWYGTSTNNPNAQNTAVKMGALLALPPTVVIANIGLSTEPAKQLAWTLQNYGAYIDEDSYGNSFLISTENGPDGAFTDQFQTDYGMGFNQASNATGAGGKWSGDIQKLLPLLQVIDNNAPTTIGGGGTPRQPLAPPIAP
jgi:hypothetical protein